MKIRFWLNEIMKTSNYLDCAISILDFFWKNPCIVIIYGCFIHLSSYLYNVKFSIIDPFTNVYSFIEKYFTYENEYMERANNFRMYKKYVSVDFETWDGISPPSRHLALSDYSAKTLGRAIGWVRTKARFLNGKMAPSLLCEGQEEKFPSFGFALCEGRVGN